MAEIFVHEDLTSRQRQARNKLTSAGTKSKTSPTREGFDHVNARSLLNKFDEFQSWIAAVKPDIVGITETWANKNIRDSELSLTGYDLFRKDRPVDREGGGVMLYVNSDLQAVTSRQ